MVTDTLLGPQGVSFSERLRKRAQTIGSWLCVGIDPDLPWLPSHLSPSPSGVTTFCREVIEATRDFAVCFKINFAFFEALGPDGWRALDEVRRGVPRDVPVIADAK